MARRDDERSDALENRAGGEGSRRQASAAAFSELRRSIVRRTALPEVLDSVAGGVRDTLSADVVAIRLCDAEEDATSQIVSSIGASQELLRRWRRARQVELLSASALGGRLQRFPSVDPLGAVPEFAAEGVRTALIVPLHERGRVAGTIAAGSTDPERRFGAGDEQMLLDFAEHASLALNDARAAEEAIHDAFHDGLTGLPNRALFVERLERALARLSDDGPAVAVLFCDLDGFKNVNDSLGHAAGDTLLSAISARLAHAVGPPHTVARFGGDEFAILLEDLPGPDGPQAVAAQILEALRAPITLSGREVFVGASIGIAAARAGEVPGELMRNADLAMYRAKARGRGRYELFEPRMHTEAVRRMQLEADLERAIEHDEMRVHYQPIFDLSTREVSGVEALVRWSHPTLGLIGPSDFIPLAEESGQIRALGRWVLREACRQMALWRAKYPGYGSLFVSVNLSGVQLREPDLVADVEGSLRIAQLEPEHLMLEMTETVVMDDDEGSVARLEALQALGIRLAIDDFGTGYSSLEYLDRFPIDALKIAKPFVDRLGTDPGSQAIPKAITDLAGIFGFVVIAEGIEQEAQAGQLIALGCGFGQGNLLGPARDPDQADAALFGAGLLAPGSDGEGDEVEPPAATTRQPGDHRTSSVD